jgi:hypothetical protein
MWLVLIAGWRTANATTITVGKGGGYDCDTIQAAIDAATTGDTVVVHPATYVENIHFKGKSIVLRSANPTDTATVAATIIDGNSSGSVVTFAGTETTSCFLSGFTIQHGFTWLKGGGVAGGSTHATVENNVIQHNSAFTPGLGVARPGWGGGIADCDGMIRNNTISANVAGQGGGGLHACGGTIVNNTIAGNSSGWCGGGLSVCDGLIHKNRITSNTTYNAGGGLSDCHGTISDNIISYNAAIISGGGSWDSGMMINNIITHNKAFAGGGVSECNLLLNNTIVGNSAAMASGMNGGVGGSAQIVNCIIWGNTAFLDPQLPPDSAPTYSCVQGWTGGGVGNISDDPLFTTGPLGSYYLSQYVAGQWGQSPCVDAGSTTALALGLNALTTRTDNGPDFDRVDMGYHYPPSPVLPPFIDVDPTSFWAEIREGEPLLTTRTLFLRNVGNETAVYSITTTPSAIISVRPTTGTLQPGEMKWHDVRFYTTTLEHGYFRGGLTITWNGPGGPLFVPVTVNVLPWADLFFTQVDIAPTAPVQLRPNDPIAVSALVKNGEAGWAPPFWIEVWGSRTGGLTLDRFLTDSVIVPSLPSGQVYSWIANVPLYSIPDGAYTVVYVADRTDEVKENNERNNRAVVAGKRIVVVRPQTQVDLAVEGFNVSPAMTGQMVTFSGRVVNRGTEPSGPFWIEFWGSGEKPFPALNFFLCDSIYVESLDGSATIELSQYSRYLYYYKGVPPFGTFTICCFADRDDSINELDETNNYQFVDGVTFSEWPTRESNPIHVPSQDIQVVSADFSPAAPTQLAPGDPVTFTVDLANPGLWYFEPFWLEYWGSRDGGVTLSDFLCVSDVVTDLSGALSLRVTTTKALWGIPDGPYTVVVFANRPNIGYDEWPRNNRYAVPRKRLLVIRPQTGADLTVRLGDVQIVGSPPQIVFSNLQVYNGGTANSGQFWVEFWLCPGDADYPWLDRFARDSIQMDNLDPATVDVYYGQSFLYDSVPAGEYSLIVFVDRLDQVIETDETNNYVLLRHFVIPPH